MTLEQALLAILACPVDKGSLLYFEDEMILYNPRLRRRYPIRDGIPVMLAHLAEPVGEAEHVLLLGRAQVGDAVPTLS